MRFFVLAYLLSIHAAIGQNSFSAFQAADKIIIAETSQWFLDQIERRGFSVTEAKDRQAFQLTGDSAYFTQSIKVSYSTKNFYWRGAMNNGSSRYTRTGFSLTFDEDLSLTRSPDINGIEKGYRQFQNIKSYSIERIVLAAKAESSLKNPRVSRISDPIYDIEKGVFFRTVSLEKGFKKYRNDEIEIRLDNLEMINKKSIVQDVPFRHTITLRFDGY